jgi:hypothetical protein
MRTTCPTSLLRTAAEDGARRALGDDAYREAMQAGRALELPDTVDFALNGDIGFHA